MWGKLDVRDGQWTMKGLGRNHPRRIRSPQALVRLINETGFLPLFSGDIPGFSVEEHVSAASWWTGDPQEDPWVWREILAENHEVAYGKFFRGKAGFISLKWLPVFSSVRRDGYDFQGRWEDGRATRREKAIMDVFIAEDEEGEPIFRNTPVLSSDLASRAGFGRGGEKNFSGILTGLQMQTFLVISGFRQKISRKGVPYGMPVATLLPPEALWGTEAVMPSDALPPMEAGMRILLHVRERFPGAGDEEIRKVLGPFPA